MHRIDNSKYLLYIEPNKRNKSDEPIIDNLTEKMELLLNLSKTGTANYNNMRCSGEFRPGNLYRGVHTTDCGEDSTNADYLLPNGMITNSLCVFYFKYYRSSIPESEMKKVLELYQWALNNNLL